MKALLYEGPRKVAVRDVPAPEIADGEALIEVEACGLCGTDLVKIFDETGLKPPVPLGHEVAGRIARLGGAVRGFKKGDRVVVAHHVPCFECHYCLRGSPSMCREFKRSNLEPGGFAQFARVSQRHLKHTTLKIPPRLDFVSACQVEPLACCVRNARRLGLQKGDTAVIVGLGSIGLMTAQLLRLREVEVLGFDLDPIRVRSAQKAGITRAYTGKDGGADELVLSASGRRGADALIFTAGAPALASQRLGWVRDGGVVNLFSGFHPESRAHLDLNAFYRRELTLLSSYSAAPEDLREALSLIAGGSISMEAHTRRVYPLEGFAEAIRQIRGREVLKAILLP